MRALLAALLAAAAMLPDGSIVLSRPDPHGAAEEAGSEPFELRARGSIVAWGERYRLWAQAVTPGGKPCPGVEIEARLRDAKAAARTGADGSCLLDLPVAQGSFEMDDVTVRGTRGGVVRELELEVYTGSALRALLQTDKPIYQPGQTLHVRALVLDGSGRASAERQGALHIRAPGGPRVERREVVTSRFGLLASDWRIPADAENGRYRVSVTGRQAEDDVWGLVEVDVSRYELPTFAVTVTPSRPYTLSGEEAEVTVTARHLSGPRLRRFLARIEEERPWWERRGGEPRTVAEGQAVDGSFRARLSLPDPGRRGWRSTYEDTPFAAYVTDPATGRTERSRFELRASAEPIHVYVMGRPAGHPRLLSTLYVSTFHADGTPAACDVEVSDSGTRVGGAVRTNRFGVGKLVATLPAGDHALTLSARDGRGRRGRAEERWWNQGSGADPAVRLEIAGRTLRARGEPLEVRLQASFEEGEVLVDVARGMDLLACASTAVSGGRARLRIPYSPDFVGAVTVTAYPAAAWRGGNVRRSGGRATVLYPAERKLRLEAALDRPSYRPGEQARARFSLAKPDGSPVPGVLGVAIVDRAVALRAADGDDGSRWGRREVDTFLAPFRQELEGDAELAGFHLSDFLHRAPGVRFTADEELVAEALANTSHEYEPVLASSGGPAPRTARAAGRRGVALASGAPGGRIEGVVTDDDGEALAGVRVECWDEGGRVFGTLSDAGGAYTLLGLPPGLYSVRFSLPGFAPVTRERIAVDRGAVRVHAVLRMTVSEELVTVSAEAPALETRGTARGFVDLREEPREERPVRTPRVRGSFPETLVHEPQLLTDARGRAELRFRMADNLTTWTVQAVASTERGEVGFARADVQAFQPFFLELEPPRVLTVGDEIALPVVVRNELRRAVAADLAMEEASWFRALDVPRRRVEVASGETRTERFRIRAEHPVLDGPQRVTALGVGNAEASDAVEKPVTVRLDAEERHLSRGALLRGRARIAYELPADALAGTASARLTIYPDLTAQLSESLEAVLRRPHGCGEQTISSTYPSVLALRHLKASLLERPGLEARARGYLEAGLERLRGFQESSGGFRYFSSMPADAALTVYAVTFLLDAAEVGRVDERMLDGAVRWLIEASDRPMGDPSAAALAAEALGRARSRDPLALAAGRKVLATLDPHLETADATLAAACALAARELGDAGRAGRALRRLTSLAGGGAGGALWSGGAASPFHIWGRAADLLATALAVRALAGAGAAEEPAAGLASRGLESLLDLTDTDGTWLSGHTTVRVLQALVEALRGSPGQSGAPRAGLGKVRIGIGGKPVDVVEIAPGQAEPLAVDLSRHLAPGAGELTLEAPGGLAARVRLALRYAVPWGRGARPRSRDLALQVTYGRTEARTGEDIEVQVSAARTGAGGGGMLLVEVGVPPGAEVDRAILSELARGSRGGVHRAEVQPDRVVFYVWPHAGEQSSFSFRFRPRYPIAALTAPSSVADYYNPDARAVVPPTRFVVR